MHWVKQKLQETVRHCGYCDEVLKGNSNEKFCDSSCRSAVNNLKYKKDNKVITKINRLLKRNRDIMRQSLGKLSTVIVAREKRISQEFDFDFTTHWYENEKGEQYEYCYDYGYLELKAGKVLLVKDTKQKEKRKK